MTFYCRWREDGDHWMCDWALIPVFPDQCWCLDRVISVWDVPSLLRSGEQRHTGAPHLAAIHLTTEPMSGPALCTPHSLTTCEVSVTVTATQWRGPLMSSAPSHSPGPSPPNSHIWATTRRLSPPPSSRGKQDRSQRRGVGVVTSTLVTISLWREETRVEARQAWGSRAMQARITVPCSSQLLIFLQT